MEFWAARIDSIRSSIHSNHEGVRFILRYSLFTAGSPKYEIDSLGSAFVRLNVPCAPRIVSGEIMVCGRHRCARVRKLLEPFYSEMSGLPRDVNPFQEALNMATSSAVKDLDPIVKLLNSMGTREAKLSAKAFGIVLRWMASCTSISNASERPDPTVYNSMLGTTSEMTGGIASGIRTIVGGKSEMKRNRLKQPILEDNNTTMTNPPPQPTKRTNKLKGFGTPQSTPQQSTRTRPNRLIGSVKQTPQTRTPRLTNLSLTPQHNETDLDPASAISLSGLNQFIEK